MVLGRADPHDLAVCTDTAINAKELSYYYTLIPPISIIIPTIITSGPGDHEAWEGSNEEGGVMVMVMAREATEAWEGSEGAWEV